MRLLLIEDDIKIASFILKGLKEAEFVVDHAEDGIEGLHMAVMGNYNVIIVDLMLPALDGLTIIEKLRQQENNTPIIILSAKRSLDDRVRGLQKGGDDYLTKPFAFSELLARIQTLIRRASGVLESHLLTVADLSINIHTREVIRGGKKIDLQPLEFSLIEYLMRNAGRVVSKTMIIERVWDYDFDPQTNVIETRICKLRDKVDRNYSKKLIKTIRGVGYMIEDA